MKSAIVLTLFLTCAYVASGGLVANIANGVWAAIQKDVEKQAVKIIYEGAIKEGLKVAIAEGIPKIKEIGTAAILDLDNKLKTGQLKPNQVSDYIRNGFSDQFNG